MKYSKEFYMLLAHINPAIYDVIFPHGPIQNFSGSESREFKAGNYQTQGNVFGTDLSGDLKVLAKLSWRMKNLTEDLRAVVVHAKSYAEQGNEYNSTSSVISELIDEYCGNGIRFPFPPRPHWFDRNPTIAEKVAAASLFVHASSALEGTEIESALQQGADKILDSAIEQVAGTKSISR